MTEPSDNILLSIGPVAFVIGRSAFDKINRSVSFRWTSLQRRRGRPQMQFDGFGDETIKISGDLYQTDEIEDPRIVYDDLKGLGEKPQAMVDANGTNLGLWCITSLSYDGDEIDRFSIPRKISFSLELKQYDKPSIQD